MFPFEEIAGCLGQLTRVGVDIDAADALRHIGDRQPGQVAGGGQDGLVGGGEIDFAKLGAAWPAACGEGDAEVAGDRGGAVPGALGGGGWAWSQSGTSVMIC